MTLFHIPPHCKQAADGFLGEHGGSKAVEGLKLWSNWTMNDMDLNVSRIHYLWHKTSTHFSLLSSIITMHLHSIYSWHVPQKKRTFVWVVCFVLCANQLNEFFALLSHQLRDSAKNATRLPIQPLPKPNGKLQRNVRPHPRSSFLRSAHI